MPVAAQMVAGNLSLGRLEKGVFRLLCFAKEILLFKWLFGNSLCVCVQQGAAAAHFNSRFRLCLGVALAAPRVKGGCVYNLLLGCFLPVMVSGPGISTWTGLCERHKDGNTQELLFAPPNHLNSWKIDWKRPSQETWPGTTCISHQYHLWIQAPLKPANLCFLS